MTETPTPAVGSALDTAPDAPQSTSPTAEPMAMTTSTTDPAFAELLELVGRRWTLRIIWELRSGRLAFNELRKRAGGMSQSVLVTRLTELFGAGLVADVEGGYQLTAHGAELAAHLSQISSWSLSWAHDR